jgi:hypothetical protein
MVEIVGDASSLHRALDESEQKTTSLGSKLGGLGKAAALAGGAAGVALLTEGLKSSIDVALKDQAAMAKLTAAVKAQGGSIGAWKKDLDAAQASGRKLGFENSQVTDTLAKFATAGDTVRKSVGDMAFAENLARVKHIALADAATQVIKLHAGATRLLKEFGDQAIKLTTQTDALKAKYAALKEVVPPLALEHAKLADKLASAAANSDLVRQKVEGQAAAYAGTAAGGMAQFKAGLDDIEGKIGAALLPVMQRLMDWVNSNWPAISKVVSEACKAIGIAIEIAKPIITSLLAPFQFVAKAFDDIVHGKWLKLWDDFVSFASSPINEVKRLLSILAGYLSGPASAAWGAMKDAARTAMGALRTAYDNSFAPAIDAIKSALGWIRDKAGAAWGVFSGAISTAWGAVKGILGAMSGAISAVVGALKDLIGLYNSAKSLVGLGGSGKTYVPPYAPPWLKPGHKASGGTIDGSPGQAVPIVAHAGEYVLRSSATKKIGVPALAYMNATGNLPRFDFGGVVLPKDKGPLNATTGLPDDPAYRSAAMYLNDYGADRNVTSVGTALAGLIGPGAQAKAAIRHTYVDGTELHAGMWRAPDPDAKAVALLTAMFPDIVLEKGTPGQQISAGQALSRISGGLGSVGGWIQQSMGLTGAASKIERMTSHAIHFGSGYLTDAQRAAAAVGRTRGGPPFVYGDMSPSTADALTQMIPLKGLVPTMATGGRLLSDGLFYGHKGERVTPASVSRGTGPIQLHTTIELNGRVLGKAVQDFLGEQQRWGGPTKVTR